MLIEPFSWIFYCYFQPDRFQREFGEKRLVQRIKCILRLTIPMFLFCYPFGLLGQLLLLYFHISIYSNISTILLPTTLGIAVSIVVGIAVSIADGIGKGITFGIAGGIGGSIAFGIAGGIGGGIAGGIASGITVSIASGIAIGIEGNIAAGIVVGIIVGIIVGIVSGITSDIPSGIAVGIPGGITYGIAFGIVGDITVGIAGGIAICIAGGIAIGIAGGITIGIVRGIASGIVGGIASGIAASIAFITFYLIGLYRLPLYPISGGTFLFQTYIACRKNPQQVFTALRNSSLHWDERVYLPLLFLKRILLIALEEDITRTMEEITFIAAERPQQIRAAHAVVLEIAIRDLEKHTHLVSIAETEQHLNEIFPPEANLIDPHWVTPFARLRDASQDAARACGPIGRQARIDALEDMKTNLLKIHPNVAFRDQQMNRRLGDIIKAWLEIAQQEQDKLQHAAQELGRIDNPYKPGQVLKVNDTLFVGRRDLAQQLEEALSRGDRRPTFMLNGERRMGKSTTLVHLPLLLGSHYLPIFCDLQNPGVISNSATFLGMLAREIQAIMNARGMQVKPLAYEFLREARKESDAAVYHEFDRWLDSIEQILVQENRTLLLMFDEFEKLNEEQENRQLQLSTLLNWFRNVMQYRLRVVLLFSGVHTIGEMAASTDVNWSSYFVNVQTLRVSFLQVEEARQLITRPVPDYPSEEIFGEGVVTRILAETGCHPFFVQAVCSSLIDHLNVEKREQAQIADVDAAVQQVLDAWWDTYFRDLWNRTNEEQRICLATLLKLGKADLARIVKQSTLNEGQVKRNLQKLRQRDLVLPYENEVYDIASPIFRAWVERSVYN
jgi:uncharacterized protein